MITTKLVPEPIPTIRDLPLNSRQRRDLLNQLDAYNTARTVMASVERDVKEAQTAIRNVVESLGTPKFLADLDNGVHLSITYGPQTKESIDRAELIRLGVDPAVVDAATKRTEFFVMRVSEVR